jgi:hypothetical protein
MSIISLCIDCSDGTRVPSIDTRKQRSTLLAQIRYKTTIDLAGTSSLQNEIYF